jgi:aryl sulfotransferase
MKEKARMTAPILNPTKTREIQNHHMDSTIWNRFKFRPDDVIISTYAKSGTTWTQQIVSQLIFKGAEDVNVPEISPWVDMRIPAEDGKLAALEAQRHRRFMKTHLPLDAFVFRPELKHIYIARDGRDVVWSLHNHHMNANARFYELINDTPGRVGPPIPRCDPDIRRYFLNWLENDGAPFWSMWENVRTWWSVRRHPSVLMLHYADMKKDLEGTVSKIAAFLDVDLDGATLAKVVEHSSFDYMKRNAAKSAPLGGIVWEGGAGTFINKGANGRWRDVLADKDSARYEATARAELGEECARWLAEGGPIRG